MTNAREAEVELMKLTADNLISSGYSVVFEPSSSQLPPELREFRPDGIAIGKKPYLVIEVTGEGRGLDKTEKLRQAIKDNPDWQLYVVFNRGKSSQPLKKESLENIESFLKDIPRIAAMDLRAALLSCWAALEAFARHIDPVDFGRPQTPGRIIEQLASQSYIVPSEATFLREEMKKRNEFVHGQLSTTVSSAELDRFVEFLRALISAHRRTNSEL